MSPKTQGVLLAGLGYAAAHAAASGAYLAYLKASMRIPLLVAGVVMLILGLLTLARHLVLGDRADHDATPDGHDHDHGHGPRVAWLLALPLLALVLVDPPALGADAARRDTAASVPEPTGSTFDPLPPPHDGAVTVRLGDFVARAYYDERESLAGVPVRLTGFVVRDPDIPDGYRLTRFAMACCAGDAFPVQVTVRGLDTPPPPDDTWVQVVGEWIAPNDPTAVGAARGAALDVTTQTEVPAPSYRYE